MEEKKKRNKITIALVVIGILLIVGIVVGLSYAYWTYTASQGTVNKITSDCIEVTITDETAAINLEKTYPITDAEAANLSPYTFKVTNTCNMSSSYSINLEVMDVADRLSSNLVAVSFNGGAKSILSSNTSVDTTYDEEDYTAIEAYNLGSGKLAGGASESYTLKLWIDESATNNDSMKKTFISKITVTAEIAKLCKRATTLHTETCSNTYCKEDGYAEGETITYGNLGTTGTLTSGDAFDCDVNGDGNYDSATERFYYVTDMNASTSVLVYYNNVSEGVPNNTTTYAYQEVKSCDTGPEIAMLQLPTTSQWKTVKLTNTLRDITDETGTLKTSNFSYEGYAARFLTYQEINAGCFGELETNGAFRLSSKCKYLMENTKYSNNSMGLSGIWLETPYSSYSILAWLVNISRVTVAPGSKNNSSGAGVRPTIEVLKSNIEY